MNDIRPTRVQSVDVQFLNKSGISNANPFVLRQSSVSGNTIGTTNAPTSGTPLDTSRITLDPLTAFLELIAPPGSVADMILSIILAYPSSSVR
jgi:hypothetical protein